MMLDAKQVDRIVSDAAISVLKAGGFERVTSVPTSNSDGEDALLVTIVLPEKWQKRVTGERALDTIVKIRQELSKAGEFRLPIVEFATENELAQLGGR